MTPIILKKIPGDIFTRDSLQHCNGLAHCTASWEVLTFHLILGKPHLKFILAVVFIAQIFLIFLQRKYMSGWRIATFSQMSFQVLMTC